MISVYRCVIERCPREKRTLRERYEELTQRVTEVCLF